MPIQRLQPHHAAVYRQLMLEAYALQPDAFTSSVAERAALPLSWWEARLQNTPDTPEMVMGALMDDQLVGVAGIRFGAREKSRHKATLFGMYVRLPYRQIGLGRQLVEAAVNGAKDRPGVEIVQLTVSEGNLVAQTLYERCGFEAFGVEPYAVTLDAVDKAYVAKVHMWHGLVPELQSPNDFEHQIIAAEERLRLAMLGSKVSVLDELISPQLLFTTHLGELVNKKDDLAMHASGALRFHALEPHNRHIRLFGSGSAPGVGAVGAVGVVSVLMHMSGIHSGVPFSANLLYTRVWQRGNTQAWQIIAGHSSVAHD